MDPGTAVYAAVLAVSAKLLVERRSAEELIELLGSVPVVVGRAVIEALWWSTLGCTAQTELRGSGDPELLCSLPL